MSISPGFTNDEIRDLVYAYEQQPYGTKTAWLETQAFTEHMFRRWQAAVYGGDLERALIPRDDEGVSTEHAKRRRDAKGNSQRDAQRAARITELETRVRELEGTNEALGKAIGLLHKMNEQEPADTPTTTDQPGSSSPKTSS